ncbi:hypothetical protein J7T55_015518 [Diaporthe amygdali]|uniref:uncharacterized protein n=1 Tax=Phomopsis amygdali TaxID=1214568 RepID=UPI0022FF0907|nr:uncharacterized protein J7T55_015518 [Diaporthe amygdali]KAJ0120784.1 hypothetical protein J7T55_015518 [Diaporthe amygdali]
MTIITDLAARKAYLLGQLNEVDGAQSSLSRNQQLLKLWREFKQVETQLEEAYTEAEAKKSQSSLPGVSVQEGTNAAARAVSECEADNAIPDHSSPGKMVAPSSDTASKGAPRKVAFQLPEASDHSSHSESPGTSSTNSSIESNKEPTDPIDFEDGDAMWESLMARMHPINNDGSRFDKYKSLVNDGDDNSDHSVLPRHQGSQDEMGGSHTSTESQEKDSS